MQLIAAYEFVLCEKHPPAETAVRAAARTYRRS